MEIPLIYFCDGSIKNGNGLKDVDCTDGSDEDFDVCCFGEENYPYSAYNEEYCNNLIKCDDG